jgi:membrane dipeptidase
MALAIDVDALHRRVPITDGHADSLMWNRDLTLRSTKGHVDFPRLEEAGVKIQCFTVVTRGLPVIDGFSLFAAAQGWPRAARATEWSRCEYQLGRLEAFCAASNDRARITPTPQALTENLAAGRLSAVLGIEGAHALEGRVDRVAELHRRGVRFMSLTHLANNELGGTSTPFFGNRPLTAHGREVLEAMAHVGMLVDVAHASEAVLGALVEHPTARLFCSHTGVKGATDVFRNLPDAVLRRIADQGGVVGIIFAPQFVGGRDFADVARHIEYALGVMGEDGVALGSDFDGLVPLPRGMHDVTGLKKLTACLLDRGVPSRVVEKVLGDNFRRFFGQP